MSKFLKLSMIAVMALGVASCSDDKDEGSAKKCDNGKKQCTAGLPYLCVDGVWVAQKACDEGIICSDGMCGGGGGDTCTSGEKKCSGNVPQLCEDGAWAAKDACEEGQTCSNGVCEGGGDVDCTDGEKKCSASDLPQLCVEEEWVDQAACEEGQTCSNGGCSYEEGAECDEDTFIGLCEGNKFIFCDDGRVEADDRDSTDLESLCLTFASHRVYGCTPASMACETADQSQLCQNLEENHGVNYLWAGACHVASNGKSYMVELEEMEFCSGVCSSATSCEIEACSSADYVASCDGNIALICAYDYVSRWNCNAIGATCRLDSDNEDKPAYCDDEV